MADTPASFLSLPPSIRRRVLNFAGLSRVCPLVISREQSVWVQPQRQQQQYPPIPPQGSVGCRYRRLLCGFWAGIYQNGPDCYCPEIPKQLMLVSKAIYNDAHAVLYSSNSFALRAREARDLGVLKRLSRQSIREMTCLMVRLNCWPCPRGDDLVDLATGKCMVCITPTTKGDFPLCARSKEGENMLQTWAEICGILTSHVTAGRLCFTVICDVKNITTAERLLRPLSGIPRLKSCTIRLGRSRDEKLCTLARTTSLKLTATYQHAHHEGSSRISFTNLPREIRLRILRFTHLGEWGSFSEKHTNVLIEKQTLVQRFAPAGKPLKACCTYCSSTKKDCCCPLRYAAYSESCQCRVPPLDMLLVSRQMDMDASEILYSTNTFVFRGAFTDALGFLESLRPSTLRLFRRISFVFVGNDSWNYGNWSMWEETWIAIIRLIRDNFCISALTITVDASCDEEDAMWADEDEDLVARMRKTYVGVSRAVKDMLVGLRGYRLVLGFDDERYHHILSVDKELASLLEKDVIAPELVGTQLRPA